MGTEGVGDASVDLQGIDGNDIALHTHNIQGMRSFNQIANYIENNIIGYFNNQSPPDTNASDRVVIDLISNIAQNNPELAAIIYHAADETTQLTVLNHNQSGNRKLKLGNTEKSISDNVFKQIAKASNGAMQYANDYYQNTPQGTSSRNNAPQSDASNRRNDDAPTEEPALSLSGETLAYLPKDISAADLDEILIIDLKTGDEVDPKDFDMSDPDEAKEYREILDRSVTIYTDGSDGLTDSKGSSAIVDAIVQYVTSPYTNKISEDGLEEILDELTPEMASEIFFQAQKEILNSNNPADKVKLNNFKNKSNSNGLDRVIADLYNDNYMGGNMGEPGLFLLDIFKNDPSLKLNGINVDKISTMLSEQLTAFLDADEEDRDPKYLNFIQKSLEQLSGANPDNIIEGHLSTLLQQVLSKTKGDEEAIKEILADMSHQADIETFQTVSLNTGHEFTSHFGEYTYTDDRGNRKTFDSTLSGNFNQFKTDIIGLITGTHSSLKEYQNDTPTKAVIASQAADMLVALSPEQQQAIIEELSSDPQHINYIQNLATLSGDTGTNLIELSKKLEKQEHLTDLKSAVSPEGKASIFADIITTFSNPNDPIEMQAIIDSLVTGDSFLGFSAEDFTLFMASLETDLQEAGIANPQSVLDIMGVALSSIEFEASNGSVFYANQVLGIDNLYMQQLLDSDAGLEIGEAKQLFDSLTPANMDDPALFSELLADNQSFNTAAEYDNFMQSIGSILEVLSEKSGSKWDALKTNLTTLLLTNKPDFTFEPAPMLNSDTDDDEHGSYLAYLTKSADNKIQEYIENDVIDAVVIANDSNFSGHIIVNLGEESSKYIEIINENLRIRGDTAASEMFNTNLNSVIDISDNPNVSSARTLEAAKRNYNLKLESYGGIITSENFKSLAAELTAVIKHGGIKEAGQLIGLNDLSSVGTSNQYAQLGYAIANYVTNDPSVTDKQKTFTDLIAAVARADSGGLARGQHTARDSFFRQVGYSMLTLEGVGLLDTDTLRDNDKNKKETSVNYWSNHGHKNDTKDALTRPMWGSTTGVHDWLL
ncbi:MAG: hypothetical protein ACJARD_000520 [Alphaproteobacteria bacterium]|jgi:hypothetical protein